MVCHSGYLRTQLLLVCILIVHSGIGQGKALSNEPYVTGYPKVWSNPSGQPAEFYLSGRESRDTPLTIYDVSSKPRANFVAPLEKQAVASTNMEPWKDGFGWESQTIDLPDLPSGLYFIGEPENDRRSNAFIISEPEKQADIVVIYPTNTVNAYSPTPNFNNHPNFGENVNLYSRGVDNLNPKAMSFHRPMRDTVYQSRKFDQMLLHERDESYKYISDADLEDYSAIENAKLVVIPSHSEYWTENARRNFDKFVEKGGSALVLAGNVMYRAIEYDDPDNPTQMKFWPRRQFTSAGLDYPIWESIGSDFLHGGYGPEFRDWRNIINNPFDGYKILDTSKAYFEGTGLSEGDIIHNPAREYDGVPFTSVDPETGPVVDHELLGFHRMDVVAFENTRVLGRDTAGTWIDFQKTADSGRVINVGEAHWSLFIGEDGPVRKELTHNIMDLLLITQADFDEDDTLTGTDVDLLVAETKASSPRLRFDLTEDGQVNVDDLERWLNDFAETRYGDANLDGHLELVDYLAITRTLENPAVGPMAILTAAAASTSRTM